MGWQVGVLGVSPCVAALPLFAGLPWVNVRGDGEVTQAFVKDALQLIYSLDPTELAGYHGATGGMRRVVVNYSGRRRCSD